MTHTTYTIAGSTPRRARTRPARLSYSARVTRELSRMETIADTVGAQHAARLYRCVRLSLTSKGV